MVWFSCILLPVTILIIAGLGEFKEMILSLFGFNTQQQDEDEKERVPGKNENVNTNDVIDHSKRSTKID